MAECSNETKGRENMEHGVQVNFQLNSVTMLLFCWCHTEHHSATRFSPAVLPQRLLSRGQQRLSYPGGFDLVASVAHPAGVVGECLAFLSLQARLHFTPPLSNYDGCWRQQRQARWMQVTLTWTECRTRLRFSQFPGTWSLVRVFISKYPMHRDKGSVAPLTYTPS